MQPPILANKDYDADSVFTVENMLREARRQKRIAAGHIPPVCVLDPDGDLAQYLIASGRVTLHPHWACYHTRMYAFEHEGIALGIVPNAVGSSFAVLVADELFASGCQLLISVTSAGQIVPAGDPPYFVLIDRALRDEGTSYHYLPPAPFSALRPHLVEAMEAAFSGSAVRVLRGATWTTDAPFRETPRAIAYAHALGILGVEMEASALYAYAQVRSKNVICFAHITNQMARIEGDFEKGVDQGSHDALAVIACAARHGLPHSTPAVE
jgi:uridine phosphorylase